MIVELPAVDPGLAELGRRLRRVREARRLSVAQLGQAARAAPSRLALAEQGRARLTSAELHALINALRIPLDLLFRDADVSRLRPLQGTCALGPGFSLPHARRDRHERQEPDPG
jgi:transcriptional regulator with XRE-family HTH domain